MIRTRSLTERFGQIVAMSHINATIEDGSVFSLIGINGAGKSTFLRMASGVLKPNEGGITINGKPVFEGIRVKPRFFYISDDQFFFNNATPNEMMSFYMTVYPKFDKIRYIHLIESFDLERKRKINTFSKGMKKQMSVICGVCAGTDYLFCDKTFDGLDPMMRQTVKSIFVGDMRERNLAPIIAPHNLQELEDICDHVGLLRKDGILLSKDLNDMKLNTHKIQCVLEPDMGPEDLVALGRVKIERRGSLYTLTVRRTGEEVEVLMADYHPVFAEIIPLSLGKIFISEIEVTDYDIKKLVL